MTQGAALNFELEEAIPVLERTPAVLLALLDGLPDRWTRVDEGPETWSPRQVIGHLIKDLDLTGEHPEFGNVTMRQLLATWVVHDLSHIAQISRTMTRAYTGAVGPWTAYFRVLQRVQQ